MYYLYALYSDNWVDILPKSNNLSWSSDKDTLSTELNFDSIYDLSESTHIVLKNDTLEVVTGTIIKKAKKKFTNSYTVFDYGFYLKQNETLIQFNGVIASLALKQLCDKFGISHDIVYIPTIIKKNYNSDSLATIIDDILDLATSVTGLIYAKEMIGSVLTIRILNELKIYPTFLIGKDITVNSSIENMKNSVLATSNGEKNTHILAAAEDSININNYGKLQEVLRIEEKNEALAQTMANNFLKLNNKIFKDTSIPLLALTGGDDIKANRYINLSIVNMGLDGWYKIKSASHTLSNNNHKVNISIEW